MTIKIKSEFWKKKKKNLKNAFHVNKLFIALQNRFHFNSMCKLISKKGGEEADKEEDGDEKKKKNWTRKETFPIFVFNFSFALWQTIVVH